LREALADHLGRTRGVIAEPEQIIVVQGTAQGVWLLLQLLSERGASRWPPTSGGCAASPRGPTRS
jgi:GntR family transcriptional regulator/MocR family aminotransferase